MRSCADNGDSLLQGHLNTVCVLVSFKGKDIIHEKRSNGQLVSLPCHRKSPDGRRRSPAGERDAMGSRAAGGGRGAGEGFAGGGDLRWTAASGRGG